MNGLGGQGKKGKNEQTASGVCVLWIMCVYCGQCIYVYSTPRRSLCVRPDAGRVWTIFPPTHCTHKYLASVRHRALASASVLLRPRPCPCVPVRAPASASVLLRVRPPVCVSVCASACPSARLCVRPCVCRSGRASAGRVQIYIFYVIVHAIGKIDFEM